jgi:hypothetical protein
MTLKGNLRDFTVTQLFNLINIAQKTGTLIVDSTGEEVWVAFREGKLAFAQTGKENSNLALILYKTRKITASQYKVITQNASNMSDKELGLLLINASYISQQEILNSLQTYFVNVVNRLFTWPEGIFRFESGLLPPEDKILVRIGLENIIIEGTRRLKEWEMLQDEIPSLEMALKFSDRPGANLRNVNLSVDEWRVVSYINPKNTIRQIAQATKKSDIEIRRIVYSLLQAGLVEMLRPDGQPRFGAPSQYPLPQKTKEEQKSLINRLISRIRSI